MTLLWLGREEAVADLRTGRPGTGLGRRNLRPVAVLFVLGFYWLAKKRQSKVTAAGRVVAITGCDSGVGYSSALHCYERGFIVVAMVLDEGSSGAKALRQLDKDSGRLKVVYVDVTKPETMRAAVRQVEQLLENSHALLFHALVNNAGVMVFGETEWQTDHTVDLQVAVNLTGPITLTRYFAPLLRKYKGRVINVSSHCASLPLPGFAVYGASKAGLQAWSEGLRVEWSKYGITVITLLPGAFVQQTNILSHQAEQAAAMKKAMTPEAEAFYGKYFTVCQQYMSALSGERPATAVNCSRLYSMLDGALLRVRPKTFYHITPWRYWVYHSLALSHLTPVTLRDWLVSRFTNLPKFTPAE